MCGVSIAANNLTLQQQRPGRCFFFFEKKSRTLFMTYEGRGAENFKKIFQESNESK